MIDQNVSNIEKLVSDLGAIQELAVSLHQQLEAVEKILDDEEAAIGTSDLKSIEAIVPKKESCGQGIEKLTQKLKSAIAGLRNYPQFAGLRSKEGLDVSEFIQRLEQLQAQVGEQRELASQVLDYMMSKTRESCISLRERRYILQPKIEANAYLVRRLLHHHHETFRFWQNLAQETEAVYGAEGKTKAQNGHSMLEIKT